MEYKILINKEAVPVLIPSGDNSDPDTWFALEDESHHIRFKEEPTEVLKDIFGLMNFAPQSLVSAELENQRGQTFPLPENVSVSWEYQIKSLLREHDWNKINEKNYNDCLNSSAARMVRKLAILSTEPAASQHVPKSEIEKQADEVERVAFEKLIPQASEVQQGRKEERYTYSLDDNGWYFIHDKQKPTKVFLAIEDDGGETLEKVTRVVNALNANDGFERDVEKSVWLVENFTKGYLHCISELNQWNGGLENPCHLDLYNRLLTMTTKIKERATELLK